ncbi:MAG: YifB family Mg chelatase-like AAA ATPase [Arenicella sp.]|nr:YifB family Mg chelatase-like AAA ATPase [Arenicella sp.]
MTQNHNDGADAFAQDANTLAMPQHISPASNGDDLATVYTRTLIGVDAAAVAVEVHLANGLPCFNIVGLPETAIKESKERVRAALVNAGFDFPARRITVNLSPADLPKSGSQFDLPIAVGVLIASSQVVIPTLENVELIGELALNGELRRVRGALPCVWAANQSKREIIVPLQNAAEAGLVADATCYGAYSLLQVCKHLMGIAKLNRVLPVRLDNEQLYAYEDLADVKGQPHAKRALEIAAAGKHNMLMMGPPGAGKSMLAQRLPSILPPFEIEEALASATVRSIADGDFQISDWARRPFRSPHHSCSSVALIGGGSIPKPGEVSQAHGGVLFLDEITEFTRHALEQLREPLESGYINIARANQSVRFPAACQLLAACNPCKCGYYGDDTNRCQCSAASLQAYQGKLSGPLMDRIDLHLKLSAVKLAELQKDSPPSESSVHVRARFIAARNVQLSRQGCLNSELSAESVDPLLRLKPLDIAFLLKACEKLGLSARGFYRVKKIARTIADLDSSEGVERPQLAEALSYRSI